MDQFGRHCAAFRLRFHRALHSFGNQRDMRPECSIEITFVAFNQLVGSIGRLGVRSVAISNAFELNASRSRSVLNTERKLDLHTWLPPLVTVPITEDRELRIHLEKLTTGPSVHRIVRHCL